MPLSEDGCEHYFAKVRQNHQSISTVRQRLAGSGYTRPRPSTRSAFSPLAWHRAMGESLENNSNLEGFAPIFEAGHGSPSFPGKACSAEPPLAAQMLEGRGRRAIGRITSCSTCRPVAFVFLLMV
ncbi:unnamed protein product, partial [Scytosiphon promiscuus]